MMNNKFLWLVLLLPLLFSCQKYNKAPFDEKEKAIRNFPETMDVLVLDSLWEKRDSLSYLRLKQINKILLKNSETTTNKTEKTITENPLYQVRGSAFDLGSKYLILYKGFEEYPKIVVHEILHCLELRHSFDDDAKHMFKPYETENFMDYVYGEENDNRKQLWKWQWQIIWNYIDNQH